MLPYLELAERLATRGHRVSFVSTPRVLYAACTDHDNKVDLLMVDSFHYWAAAAAAQHKVPCLFSDDDSTQYGVPRVSLPLSDATTPPSIPHRVILTLEKCKLVACRSCVELEPEPMPLLSGIFGKPPVIPFGLLPPSLAVPAEGHRGDTALPLRWLRSQTPKSVVFVALGSEPPITVEQLQELALGLELAGAAFLWALKRSTGVAEAGRRRPASWLRGANTWPRPRRHVLGSPARGASARAVGAFLTHCEWSSVVEGLVFGQPLITLPFLDEEGINTRLMETKHVGVQVPRFGEDKSFSREEDAAGRPWELSCPGKKVGGSLRPMRRRCNRLLLEIDGKCQEKYIDEFIQFVRTRKD